MSLPVALGMLVAWRSGRANKMGKRSYRYDCDGRHVFNVLISEASHLKRATLWIVLQSTNVLWDVSPYDWLKCPQITVGKHIQDIQSIECYFL